MAVDSLAWLVHYVAISHFFVILSCPGLIPDLGSMFLIRSFSIVVDFATLPLCVLGAEKHENTASVRPGGLKNRGKKNP